MAVIVDQSVNKARWVLPDIQTDDVAHYMRALDVPEIVARMLCQRDVPLGDAPRYLSPTLKDDFPDPFSLKGMGDMAEDVAIAVEQGKKCAIFSDFDVDGATSVAVLSRFLYGLGCVDVPLYIPDRLSEGYGPNIDALRSLREQGADIVFMLDCGTTAFDVVKAGADLGLKIIIFDHHEAEEALPECWHIVNPKRKDDVSGLDMMAAVGVTFMACVAMNNRLRDRGFYKNGNISEPNLKALLDIVALGTVCDMVPLTSVNRLFVRTGFAVPHARMNVGVRCLMEVAKARWPLDTYDCGFILGPRINAGSRVHQSDLGACLLCSDDVEECKNIAWTLNDCNDKRKAIQIEMENHAISMVEAQNMMDDPLILVGHEDWHPGLSGLVAGQLKEKYKKPCCVVTYAHDLSGKKEGRGSGRSVSGIHIAQGFIDARHAGIIEKGGGHAMAGGFTVLPDKVDDLRAFLCDHVRKQSENTTPNVDITLDGVVTTGGMTTDLIDMLQHTMGPFGQENPEPVFLFRNVRVHKTDILGERHIRVMFSDWEGGARMKGMLFRGVDTPLGDALFAAQNASVDMIGRLVVNEWQGRKSAEMHIQDVAAR